MLRSPSRLGSVRITKIGSGSSEKMYVKNSTEKPADSSVARRERRV